MICPDNPPEGMHVARSLPPMGMWCVDETDVLARLGGPPASPKRRELRAIVMPYHPSPFLGCIFTLRHFGPARCELLHTWISSTSSAFSGVAFSGLCRIAPPCNNRSRLQVLDGSKVSRYLGRRATDRLRTILASSVCSARAPDPLPTQMQAAERLGIS